MSNLITKKELIFIEAAKLFQMQGYAATSMRTLAEKVGLKPSSFYSHIKSKEEILEIICNNAAKRFRDGLETILEAQESPKAQFEGIIDLHIDVALDDPSAITVFNDEWRHLSGTALENFKTERNYYQNAVLEIIEAGIKESEIKALAPAIILNAIIGMTRWLHFKHLEDESERENTRVQIKTILQQGVKK